MSNYKAIDVDAYIANAAVEARPVLNKLRDAVRSVVPDVEEKISWGVPFYRYHGELGGYAVFMNHVTFGLGGLNLESTDREMLAAKGYKTGKKTIQIQFDQKVPVATIKRLLRAQAKSNLAVKRAKMGGHLQ